MTNPLEIEVPASRSIEATLTGAREAKNLTRPQVAERLNLTVRTVTALETLDFDQLPEPTYVRGYLKNYAKLLGLDPEPLLQHFDVTCPTRPQRQSFVSRPQLAREPMGTPGRPVAYLLLALLVVGGITSTWWLSRTPAPEPTSPQALAPAPDAVDTAAPEAADAAPPALAEQSAPVAQPEALVDVTPPTEAPSAEPVEGDPAAEPAAPAAAATAPADMAATVAPGQALVLRSNGESWVDVVDADGRRLVFELLQPGDIRELAIGSDTRLPLSVLLGNAPAVDIEFAGAAVDISAHIRGNNTASFPVGSAQ